jgi:hypothetical protein
MKPAGVEKRLIADDILNPLSRFTPSTGWQAASGTRAHFIAPAALKKLFLPATNQFEGEIGVTGSFLTKIKQNDHPQRTQTLAILS